MVRRLLDEIVGMPRLMRLGLLVFALGGLLDMLYHAVPVDWAIRLSVYLGEEGILAHGITFIGMVLTLSGLFVRKPSRAHINRIEDSKQRPE